MSGFLSDFWMALRLTLFCMTVVVVAVGPVLVAYALGAIWLMFAALPVSIAAASALLGWFVRWATTPPPPRPSTRPRRAAAPAEAREEGSDVA